jgi:hypothetical protein
LKTIDVGLAVLVAAIACGAMGYFVGRASAQAPQPRPTETAVLLTVDDVRVPYDAPSLMAVP